MDSLIPDLQKVVIDYLPFERLSMFEWYRKVIEEYRSRKFSETLYETPFLDFLKHLNYLAEDNHSEIVEDLLARYPKESIKLDLKSNSALNYLYSRSFIESYVM